MKLKITITFITSVLTFSFLVFSFKSEVLASELVIVGPPCDFQFPLNEVNAGRGHHNSTGIPVDIGKNGRLPIGPGGVILYKMTCSNDHAKASISGIVEAREVNTNGATLDKVIQITNTDSGVTVRYRHLDSFAVSTGDYVNPGDIIGEIGETGLATFQHIHYEVYRHPTDVSINIYQHHPQLTQYVQSYNSNYSNLENQWSFVEYSELDTQTNDIVLFGDINGDGLSDYVQFNKYNEKAIAKVSSEDGSHYFGGKVWLDGPNRYSNYIFKLGDVTGDGLSDLVGIDPSDERFIVWESNGKNFKKGREWLNRYISYSNYSFDLADMDGDGKMDIVSVHGTDERFIVWKSNGEAFENGKEMFDGQHNYSNYKFVFGDLNGDGRSDVVGYDSGAMRVIVWETLETLFSKNGREILHTDENLSELKFQLANVNGDNRLDLVASDESNGRIVFWPNQVGQSNYYLENKVMLGNVVEENFYDYSIDVSSIQNTLDFSILAASSDGRYLYSRSLESGILGQPVVMLNDISNFSTYGFDLLKNGDGTSHISAVKKNVERFVTWENQANNIMGSHIEYYNGLNYSEYTFLTADVDNDGVEEYVGISGARERFVVWDVLGDNKRGVEWYDGPNNYSNYSFQVGDFNGDGFYDIVGADPSNERFIVWRNLGNSTFKKGAEWLNGPNNYQGYEIGVGDIDGDGLDDIVAVKKSDERYLVWTSTGSSFRNGREALNGPNNYQAYEYQYGDVNGDGRVDIVGIDKSINRIIVWTSKAAGDTKFDSGREWLREDINYSSYEYEVGDIDGNGMDDIVGGLKGTNERFIVWYSNNGSTFNGGVEVLKGE